MAKDKVKVLGKIATTVEAFVAALNNTLVDKKAKIDILRFVRVQGTTIFGTNLDVATIVPFMGKGKGDFLIPHKRVLDFLSGEKGPLIIEYTETKDGKDREREVRMTVGAVDFTVGTKNVGDYPVIPPQSEPTFTISGKEMKDIIQRTEISISSVESRYTINATMLRATDGIITAVATDGHRLSHVVGTGTGYLKSTLVSPQAMLWVKKNCGGYIEIGIAETYQTIRTSTGTVVSRAITGNFPEFEKVMPNNNKIAASFSSPKELNDILNRVAKCSDERSGAVRLTISPQKLTIRAESTERGSAKAEIKCETKGISSDSLSMSFNYEFLSDFFKSIGKDAFTMTFKDTQSPGLMESGNFKYIVMPMRI